MFQFDTLISEMKTYVYLDNYRGFQDAVIPVKQVNFLVGENSSGKTSFLEILDTLNSQGFWSYDAEINQQQIRRRHFSDLVSASSKNKSSFTIGVFCQRDKSEDCQMAILITYKNFEGRPKLHRFTKVLDGKIISIQRSVPGNKSVYLKSEGFKFPALEDFHDLVIQSHKDKKGFKRTEVPEPFGGAPFIFQVHALHNPDIESTGLKIDIPHPFEMSLAALAPIRTRPLRTYDEPQTSFSREGKHTPYVIQKRLSSKSDATTFRNALSIIGESSGLFKSIHVKEYGKGVIRPFEIDITLGNHSFTMENVGYGVSQALPIIVEMLVRPKDSSFSIQQPEVHLHPRAQAAIGDLIAGLARDEDKKFFVETHSDYLIDRYRINLKKNPSPSIDSQILFFERKDGVNHVNPISIDEGGAISQDQPESYREFFIGEQIDLIM